MELWTCCTTTSCEHGRPERSSPARSSRRPGGLRLDGSIQLAVHAVTRGRAWVWLHDPTRAVELLPGEITLVRGGSPHFIAHEPSADCLEPHDFRLEHAQSAPVAGHAATVFLCGAYQFSGDVGNRLLDSLPRLMTLSYAIDEPLRDVISLLSREIALRGGGSTDRRSTACSTCCLFSLSVATFDGARKRPGGTARWPTRGFAPLCRRCTKTPVTPGRYPSWRRSAGCHELLSLGPFGKRSGRLHCST